MQLPILFVGSSASIRQLDNVLVSATVEILENRIDGFYLIINGYDDDHRPLWEIPDAMSFCKKLVELGFLSVLRFSGFFGAPPNLLPIGLVGAFELWGFARGLGSRETTNKQLMAEIEECKRDIAAANALCERKLACAQGVN